jgi:hypothetical protein
MPHADKQRKPQNDTTLPRGGAAHTPPSLGVDHSPRQASQQERLGGLFGPAVQRQATAQREVRLSTAPWGPTRGKWVTTLAPGEAFDSQAEAQAREDGIQAAQQAAAEEAWQAKANTDAWVFADVAGRLSAHFVDGWGASYGITNRDQLRAYISQRVNLHGEALGEHKEIDLGMRLNPDEHLSRPCKIVYDAESVVSITAGGITRLTVKRRVFHCGPTDQ